MFEPYIPTIVGPRLLSAAASGGDGGVRSAISVVYPIGIELDLSLIPASPGYKDYFFNHPYDGNLERVLVGAASSAILPGDYVVQVVQVREGQDVFRGPEKVLSGVLGPIPEVINSPGTLQEGPVFLRVTGTAAAVTLYATAQVLTSEVQ